MCSFQRKNLEMFREVREAGEERDGKVKATYCELVLLHFFTELDYGEGRRGGEGQER